MERDLVKTHGFERGDSRTNCTNIKLAHPFDDTTGASKLAQILRELVGIADYNYFTKFFKSRVGMAPLKYRKEFPFALTDENGVTIE